MSEVQQWVPGQWVARQGADTNWWFVIEDSEGRELGSGDGGWEEPEANLISAAPDFAFHAEALLNDVMARYGVDESGLTCPHMKGLATALAKARGKK